MSAEWIAAEYATDLTPRRLVTWHAGTWGEATRWVSDRARAARESRDAANWRDDRMDQELEALGSMISRADTRHPIHTFGGTLLLWEVVRRPEGHYLPVPVDQLAAWWRREPLRRLGLDEDGEDKVVRWLYGRRDTMRAVQLDTYRDDPAVARTMIALRAALQIAADMPPARWDLAGRSQLDWAIEWAEHLLAGDADRAKIEQRAGVLRESHLGAAQ